VSSPFCFFVFFSISYLSSASRAVSVTSFIILFKNLFDCLFELWCRSFQLKIFDFNNQWNNSFSKWWLMMLYKRCDEEMSWNSTQLYDIQSDVKGRKWSKRDPSKQRRNEERILMWCHSMQLNENEQISMQKKDM
jgi:hypothetical protein